ncbi:reverse transcriptase family protein [Roseateles sp. SL47]|uniref:reverse transcriptase family protein n=1 Tax=Roseateles sp. SL47 TaxID=2995138 RepID=UPI002270DC2E|nr:reverse transcriptase family protein [Roseateles sp. SL47]WAC71040.1 reverse transcriptase family protein [Roseateles sp. SL47]
MKPTFSGSPIAHPEALARALRISVQDLRTLAGSASKKYSDFLVKKKDGSDRTVSGPEYDLKLIQKRINRLLFERVEFPPYLMGGIKDRDYVRNAKIHSHADAILALDIENFFPSISRSRVLQILSNVFKQPPAVANLLADLCTKDGVVPQGACTSTYLANLIFFEHEPRLVNSLREQGLKYSRLIDDITISSNDRLSPKRVDKVIDQVRAMLKPQGLRLKRKKTRLTSASNPDELMMVTGLWLNRGQPRVLRTERMEIRKAVRKCVDEGAMERTSPDYHKLHDKVSGRVGKLAQLSHPQAAIFREQLRSVLPEYGTNGIRKTRALVAGLGKTALHARGSQGYIERYYRIMHRINILARNRPEMAKNLRQRMQGISPSNSLEKAIHG